MMKNQVIKCLAAVAWEIGKPLSIEEVEVAPPKAGEIRIQVIATGVCRSDASFLNGIDLAARFPCILGHEGCGIVEGVGEGVTCVKEGDRVIPLFMPQCYNCKGCRSPKSNICENLEAVTWGGEMDDGTSRFTCKGQKIFHFLRTSTFSQYTIVNQHSVVKIADDAPFDKVCLIGCGVSTGYGAALNTAKVEFGSTCAIWGLGGIGLAVAMGCRDRGATRIIGVDINPSKFEVGKKFGITEFVNPNDHELPIQEVILKMTDGGCDYTFECVGNVNTIRAALESCHNWGEGIVIGIPKRQEEISTIALQLIIGKTWKGSLYGGWKSKDSVPKLVERYMQKKLMLDEFITHTVKLQDINEAFDLMYQGKSIRTVVNMV